VERLDAPVHDLGKARQLLDPAHGEAAVAQRARRAAGRDELDAERLQSARELDDPGLIGDGQERATDADLARRARRKELVDGLLGDVSRI
jgi:hypothetical protein